MIPTKRKMLIAFGVFTLFLFAVGMDNLIGAPHYTIGLCFGVGAIATFAESISMAGVSIQKSTTRSANGIGGAVDGESITYGWAGTLTTRTLDTSGVMTTTATHDLEVGDTIDIFWTVGGVRGARYGADVDAETDTTITFSGGAGDNLPVEDSATVASIQVDVNVDIDGDNAKAIAVVLEFTDGTIETAAHCDFQDVNDATVLELDLVANEPQSWKSVDDDTAGCTAWTGNPITHVLVGNGHTSSEGSLKVMSIEDPTP